MCRRNHNGGRSGWMLNGLLIRAAQSIGLHRDGEHFHLPPLDCEIRRRLWWQIMGFDSRVAEDHGLSTRGLDGFCDTKVPLNVDDRDLDPNMKVAPAPKLQWTEMTTFLVAVEMNQALQQVSRLSLAVMDRKDRISSLEKLLETVKERIEEQYLQYCDPNIPIQKSALLLGRILVGKLEVLVRQQYLRGLSVEEAASRATEQTLALACDTLEIGFEFKTDELLSNFHWLFCTYTMYHLLTYALWHLCVRPACPDADRAWEVVDKVFNLTEMPGWPSPGSKWNVIRKLREKALHIRRSFVSNRRNSATDSVIPETADVQFNSAGDATGINITFEDGMLWDFDSIGFADWIGYPSGS